MARRERVQVVYVHPDGGPEEELLTAARITVKTWPKRRSLTFAARLRLYDRDGRHVETRMLAAVVSIRRVLRRPRG